MFVLAAQSFLPTVALAVIGMMGGVAVLFWLWMAVDCLVNEPESTQKSAWLLAIVFGNWIGALFYFFIRRRERLNPTRIVPPPIPTSLTRPQASSQVVVAPPSQKSTRQTPAAASSIARPSDWTVLRLLLIIFGVLVVLPTALGVVVFVIMATNNFLAVRQDQRQIAEQRQSEKAYSDFEKRAGEQQGEFQKRVAEQQADFKKRVADQEAAHKKRASLSKLRAEPTKKAVSHNTPLQPGDEVLCSWGLEWYRATVLEVQAGGDVKIHWQNWDDFFDEVVTRDRLQLPR